MTKNEFYLNKALNNLDKILINPNLDSDVRDNLCSIRYMLAKLL